MSEITLVETIVGPRKAGDVNAEAKFRVFLTPTANLIVEPISMAFLEKVTELRANHGVKIPDAIHLATGILAGCSVFVTRDASWAKMGVAVVEPQDVA